MTPPLLVKSPIILKEVGFDSLKINNRTKFINLPPALQMKANFGNDLIGKYSKNCEKLLSLENIYGGEVGEGVMFDNSGIHRGAIFDSEGQRIILQILLS